MEYRVSTNIQQILVIMITLGAQILRPNYHYNHYITISNKFCMGYAQMGENIKGQKYHFIQYITISNITISNIYCIIIREFGISMHELPQISVFQAFAPSLAELWPLSYLCYLCHLWFKWQRHTSIHGYNQKFTLTTFYRYQ